MIALGAVKMNRLGFFVLAGLMAVMPCSKTSGAELQGDWPLDCSLSNQSTEGRLKLVPYSPSGRLFLTNGCFEAGSLKMEDMALTTNPFLSAAKGVTVTGWFNLAELEMGFSATAPYTLFFLLNSANPDSQFVFRIVDGKLGAYSKSANKNLKTDFLVQKDEWTFFALVLTEESVSVYQNGYKPAIIPLECEDQYDRFYIGASNARAGRSFKGRMKNLKLYSGVLNATEIKDLYKEESLPANP